MRPALAGVATATALACAVAVAACGFGAGPASTGTATLTVTRDYGSRTLLEATDENPPESETVIRFLDSEANITTRYGGGFVQSIDGISGTGAGGTSDWFFYVNGVESPVGSADVRVKGGQKIWWDYHDWTAAMSVPAVVGSWPEPFAQASSNDPSPVRVVCLGARPPCEVTSDRLADAGVQASIEPRAKGGATGALQVLVGPWARVRSDPAVDELRGSPQSTGIFATFKAPDEPRPRLIGLDATGTPAKDLGTGAGLVAALRGRDEAPMWIVTGSGPAAVGRAADALGSGTLRNRYAVAATRHGAVPLPIVRRADAR
jgi:hypothetical protein